MNEKVNHPSHYNSHPSGIECIDITKHMNFCLGNAVKYIWRSNHKDEEIEDLEKAVWYLNCEIERLRPNHEDEKIKYLEEAVWYLNCEIERLKNGGTK